MYFSRAALGLVLTLSLPAPAWAEESCALKKLSTMPAQITPDNQLLVQTGIGNTSVPLLVDTGAGWNGLSRPMAGRLGVEFRHVKEGYPYSGDVLTQGNTVDAIVLGSVRANTVFFYALDKGGDGTDGKPAGVLGVYDRKEDVEIDPAGNAVNLFSQDHCPGKAVYWTNDYATLPVHISPWMTIDVEVDGQKLRGLIDTGASWTMMPSGHALDRFGLSEASPGMSAVPEGMTIDAQPQAASAYTFQTMKIGDIVIHNPRILIAPLRYHAEEATGSHFNRQQLSQPEIFIGMNVLKNLHLFFAYGERVVYYTGANAGRPAPK
jgi:predicted aspartyl protease